MKHVDFRELFTRILLVAVVSVPVCSALTFLHPAYAEAKKNQVQEEQQVSTISKTKAQERGARPAPLLSQV